MTGPTSMHEVVLEELSHYQKLCGELIVDKNKLMVELDKTKRELARLNELLNPPPQLDMFEDIYS